ncbi:hypothetical protein ABW21_db0206580 [Orbilia brochopaga]|nr:hypothetical protein ABW21_db0206580 [Drechslerella brochopaga]
MSVRRRILIFGGANEASGTAILYRILQTTKHPLDIHYMIRYLGEGKSQAHFLQKDPVFSKALEQSGSILRPKQMFTLRRQGDRAKISKYFLRFQQELGAHPISYIFLNGNLNYGEQVDLSEDPIQRASRLAKNWAPWTGALHGCPPRNHQNPYDMQSPYWTTKAFISHLAIMLATLLPYVRRDGEGTVVLKTPGSAPIQTIRSRDLRLGLMDPTSASFEEAVLDLRDASAKLTNKYNIGNSHWPDRKFFLGLTDLYARSALTLYRSFTPFDNIALHTCVHNPDNLDEPIRLLLDPQARKEETFRFTKFERELAARYYATDIGQSSPSTAKTSIFRRVGDSKPLPPAPSWAEAHKAMRDKYPKKDAGELDPGSPPIRPIWNRREPIVGRSIYSPVYSE